MSQKIAGKDMIWIGALAILGALLVAYQTQGLGFIMCFLISWASGMLIGLLSIVLITEEEEEVTPKSVTAEEFIVSEQVSSARKRDKFLVYGGIALCLIYVVTTTLFAKVVGLSKPIESMLPARFPYLILLIGVLLLSFNQHPARIVVFKYVFKINEMGRYLFILGLTLYIVFVFLFSFIPKLHAAIPNVPTMLLIVILASGIRLVLEKRHEIKIGKQQKPYRLN